MSKKIKQVVGALIVGVLLTTLSVLFVSSNKPYSVSRGLPLSYSTVTDGPTDACPYYASISVYWRGNCGHEEMIKSAILDIAFWSVVAWMVIYGVKKVKS